MALSKDDLRVGNTVYKLELNNNLMRRKKLSMVDSEGNEWSRYDRPMWTFTVTAMKICGSIKQVVCGAVDGDSIREDEYHLNCAPSDTIEPYDVDYLTIDIPDDWTQFFASKDQAEAAGKTYCANRNARHD